MSELDDAYGNGLRKGYMQGDNERQWLAQANSDLRSRILELEQRLEFLEDYNDVSVDDSDSYCGAWWLGWPAIALTAMGHGFRHVCIRIWFRKIQAETWLAEKLRR